MNALGQEIQSSLLNLVGSTIQIIPSIIIALLVLFITQFSAKFVRKFLQSTIQKFVRSTSLQVLLIQTGYVFTWVAGVIIASVIAFPDLRLGDIIGLLGLGSVAIGFAFQDIFKNFLAGILLLLQEPFQIGDQIVVENYEGTIENISIRSTQMLTYHGERVVIPNSILFTSPVQVKTAESHRRTDLAIGVDYNTSLPMAVETLLNATKTVEGVLSEPEVEVDVVGFGDSSIDLMIRYWTFPERKQVRRVTTQVMIALKQACDEADINIPYPIRTLYFFNQERYNDHYPAAANFPTN